MGSTKIIKGVLLDLDNVLYSYPECNHYAKTELFAFLGKKLNKKPEIIRKNFEQARRIVHRELMGQGASHSRLLYIQKCIERTTGKTNYRLSLLARDLFWKRFFCVMRRRAGVLEFLREIKKHKGVVAIVSDLTADIQMKKIVRLKIEPYIDFLVTSEEAGAEKPAPKIFELALKKLGLKPSEVVMIGDDYGRDILGAKKLGIKTIRFSTNAADQKTKGLKAKNFKEVSDIICK